VVLSVSWVLFAGVTHRFGARGAHIILSAYTIAASLAAIAGLAGYFDLIPNLRPFVVSWNRARSFFKDPNVFGPFLLAPALTCAMWIQNKSATTLNRVLVGGAAMIMLVATFLTYSRAAYATTLFGVFVYAVLTGVLRSWRSFLWLSVPLGGAVFLLSFIPDAAELLGQRLERQSYDEDRFQIFEQALTLGTSNLMGVGAGQAHLILGYGVHSMYLRLFADHGAPGLAAFLLFICACLTRMVAQIRRAQSVEARRLAALILAASVSTLLNGFVIETIHWRHLWLLLGLCWYPFPNQIQHLSAATWSRYGGQTN
jgi:O-antigen ligase